MSITVPSGTYHVSNGELQVGAAAGTNASILGAGQASTIIDAGSSSRVFDLDFNLHGGVSTTIAGLTITGGQDNTFGGAGIIGGSAGSGSSDFLTISNSTITNNHANTGGSTATNRSGGGVQFIGGSLTITNSVISNNSSGNSDGAGVLYFAHGDASGEQLTISGTTFSGNTAVANAANINSGGALSTEMTAGASAPMMVSGSRFLNNTVMGSGSGSPVGAAIFAQSGTLTVTGSTFTGNSVTGGAAPSGGAIAVLGGSVTAHDNRITGNTAATGSGTWVGAGAAAVDATDNWWGCNTGPGTTGCDAVAGSATMSPRLVLTASASPSTLSGPNASSTITASLTQNSLGATVGGAQLGAFTGLPVSWSDPQPGNASVAATSSALSSGTATTTYNSQSGTGAGHVVATLDNGTATATLTINQAPAITSANTATFTVGTASSFTVTTTGSPTPAITDTGTLPPGMTLVGNGNGNGTATLSGTPTSGGTYSLNLTAANGVVPNATQTLTVNVNQALAITANPSDQSVSPGASATFTAAASGNPTPTVQWQRSTDGGTSFSNIAGATSPTYTFTAATGDNGNEYRAVFSNASGSATSTAATLTVVGSSPTISSANATSFSVGAPGSFTVTTSGSPNPTLATTGGLPSWLSFADNGDGTATLAGTPPAGSGGAYGFTIHADNGTGPAATQAFKLTVNERPAITSADHASLTVGTAGSFTVTTTAGYPAASSLSESGALPSGVTFTDNNDGTATLGGTPAAGTAGNYPLTVQATNSAGTRQQSFTLMVLQAGQSPVITSADHTTFRMGAAGTFSVTATAGSPTTTTLTETGALPSGVSFTDNHNGTATLAGTATVTTSTSYPIVIRASNGASPDATQNFTLTVAKVATVDLPAKPPLPNGLLLGVPLKTAVGKTLTVSGSGFTPGAPITIGWYLPRTVFGHAVADSAGEFSTTVVVPNQLGIKAVMAAGLGANGKARYLATGTLVTKAT